MDMVRYVLLGVIAVAIVLTAAASAAHYVIKGHLPPV